MFQKGPLISLCKCENTLGTQSSCQNYWLALIQQTGFSQQANVMRNIQPTNILLKRAFSFCGSVNVGILLCFYARVNSHMNIIPVESEILGWFQSFQDPLSHVLMPRPPSEQNGRTAFPPGQTETVKNDQNGANNCIITHSVLFRTYTLLFGKL